MQEHKSQIYNVNTESNGNSKLEDRIKRELEISPIVVLNNNKIVQIQPADILDAIRKYSSSRSVFDEATSISIDYSLLDIEAIKAEIEKQGQIGSRQGIEIKPSLGEGEELDIEEETKTDGETDESTNKSEVSKDESEVDYKGQFAMFYARILFFAFLTDSRVKSLQGIISQIKGNTNNLRIASNLNLDTAILELFQKHLNPFILSELDYKIQNINSLANDTSIAPIDRASNAMKKFGRLSESEVVTPEFVTDKMINSLPVNAINKSTMFLDIASKQGEFVYAVYKKFGKELASNFYSIPTSSIAYEFTRKVYSLLELDINFIEKSYTSYEIIKENKLIQDDTIKINNKKMKFNVIVGNPPYQQSDGGHGRSASPIYQDFVELTKKLNPTLLSIIIPARWFAGGKGLDVFRKEMLNDKHISKLVDFENANDVFPGVDVAGGICYFLRDKNNTGLCEITNYINGQEVISKRSLNEFSIFIRHSQAIPILRKVLAKKENDEKYLNTVVSSRKPFGLPTNYHPKNSGIPCWFIQRIGLKYASKSDVADDNNLLDKWKYLVPKAPIAGQTDFSKPVGFYYDGNTKIAKPGECCTESFIVAGAFNTKKETESFKSYIYTKVVRFLLLQTVISQDVTKQNFKFIPDLGKYEGVYTDELLCKRWGITKEEWAFIDSKIKSIDK